MHARIHALAHSDNERVKIRSLRTMGTQKNNNTQTADVEMNLRTYSMRT